jgi:hypothetical protein
MEEVHHLLAILRTNLRVTHRTAHRMQHLNLCTRLLLLLPHVLSCSTIIIIWISPLALLPLPLLLLCWPHDFTVHDLVSFHLAVHREHGPVLRVVQRMLLAVHTQRREAAWARQDGICGVAVPLLLRPGLILVICSRIIQQILICSLLLLLLPD